MESLISSSHTPEYCLAHILGWMHSTLEVTDPGLYEKEGYLSLCLYIGLSTSSLAYNLALW